MGGGGSSMREIDAKITPFQTPIVDNQNLIVNEGFRIRSSGDLSGFFLFFIIIIVLLFLLLYYLG